jgi:hypothetical protein
MQRLSHLPEAAEQAHHGHPAPGFSEFRSGWTGRQAAGAGNVWVSRRCTPAIVGSSSGPGSASCRPTSSATRRDAARFRSGQRQRRPRGNGSSPVRPTTLKCVPTRGNALPPSRSVSVRAQYVPNLLHVHVEGACRDGPSTPTHSIEMDWPTTVFRPAERRVCSTEGLIRVLLSLRRIRASSQSVFRHSRCLRGLAGDAEPLADGRAAHASDRRATLGKALLDLPDELLAAEVPGPPAVVADLQNQICTDLGRVVQHLKGGASVRVPITSNKTRITDSPPSPLQPRDPE